MSVDLTILALSFIGGILLILFILVLRFRVLTLRYKLRSALHRKVELTNFLSIFAQNLKLAGEVKELSDSMTMTARYVGDMIESTAVCIFETEGDYLRASGISGPFPPMHQSKDYVFTKPRYNLESLTKEKIRCGEGIIGEVAKTKESLFIEDATKDERIANLDSIVPIYSLMAVPVINEGVVSGVVCAVNSRGLLPTFYPEQFSRLKFIIPQIVLSQNIIQGYSNLSKQQRIGQELEFARSLQASLLPKKLPPWGDYAIHSFTRSSKEMSGDFYDFVQIDEDRLLVVVGDACGKGIAACMIMAMTRSFIRANIDSFTSLADLLRILNDNLFRDTDEERFITLACCLLNKKDSTVELARAGHTPLFVYKDKSIRVINPNGSALGLLPSELSEFDTLSLEFNPDMSIMMYTDGLTEAINEEEVEYGIDALKDVYQTSCLVDDSPKETIDKIMTVNDEYSGEEQEQADDQTIVIIRHF